MSSDLVSNTDTELEHRRNFESLPFHFPDLNFFNFLSINSAYRQLSLNPLSSVPSTPLPLRVTNSSDYREVNTTPSPTSSTSQESTLSFSSLPPLVPNSDISEALNRDLITDFSTLSLSEPPVYTSSTEDPPLYEYPRNTALILRRIRILRSESNFIVAQLRELREAAILQLSTDIDTQIANQEEIYRESIRYLEDLLDL